MDRSELLSLGESGLIGGDLSIDTTDLVFGNPLASNSLRVIYTSDSNDVGSFSLSNDISSFDFDDIKKKSNYLAFGTFDDTSVPTCCDGFENSIATHGDGEERPSVSGVSVQFFEEGGQLCFHDLNIDGLSNPYGVTNRYKRKNSLRKNQSNR